MFRKIGLVLLITALLVSPLLAKEKFLKPAPVRLDHDGEKWAEKALKKMSPEEKVGQLFMVWARARFLNLAAPEYAEYRDMMQKYHVCGFALTVPADDVNSNPANPIINTRSFGEDPARVADLVTAYIRGAKANGMLTTAKHFPGHGDTATDSHLGVAQVTGNLQRLQSVELPPFR